MKFHSAILISLLAICLSCSQHDKKASANTNTETQSITAEEIEMIVNTLNSFHEIDEVKLAQQEQFYLQMLNSTEENPSEEDKHWCSKNILGEGWRTTIATLMTSLIIFAKTVAIG